MSPHGVCGVHAPQWVAIQYNPATTAMASPSTTASGTVAGQYRFTLRPAEKKGSPKTALQLVSSGEEGNHMPEP